MKTLVLPFRVMVNFSWFDFLEIQMPIKFKIIRILFIAILAMTTSAAEPERSKEEWQSGVYPLFT